LGIVSLPTDQVGSNKGGLIAAEASDQLSCVVYVLVTVDVLTTPVVSGGRSLMGRTRGVPLPRAVSRGIIGCLLPLLVEGLLFTGPSINVPVEANVLQTVALVFQGLNFYIEGLAFDIIVICLGRLGGLSSVLENRTKGLLGNLLMETRYESREFGGRRRDTLNGAQSRILQVPGRLDALRDLRGDLRRRRILQSSLDVSKEVQHELDDLVETITFMRILHAIVEVKQQARNARVRVDVDPVVLRQNLVILSGADSPGGGCVTGLRVVLRIRTCIPHEFRQTIEVVIMVEWSFFGRAVSHRCRPRRSPVVRGTRLRRLLVAPTQTVSATLQTASGGRPCRRCPRGLLVFEDVVVFGMVVFGVLIVGAGFFMRVFISCLSSAGSGDANAASLLRPCGHWEGFFERDFGRNSKGTLFNVFQNRRSSKWLVWGSVSKITW
jgi:hypothetical protein